MTYASIMVAVDDGAQAAASVGIAAQLARRFGARLVGACACMPLYPQGYGETAVPAGFAIEAIRQEALARLGRVERLFREAAEPLERIAWRSDLDGPIRFLERQARVADLVVIRRPGDAETTDPGLSVDLGDALMGLGRPVLVVPPDHDRLDAKHVLVGWKNTAQTRRAISDALPLLRRAESVRVMQIADHTDRSELDDVVAFLALHDVKASAILSKPSGWTVADDLQKTARDVGADLIVTGAYGYSRLREWFFGGVTHDLLVGASVCCLMSH